MLNRLCGDIILYLLACGIYCLKVCFNPVEPGLLLPKMDNWKSASLYCKQYPTGLANLSGICKAFILLLGRF
jgi:hypothetical protein